MIRMRADVGAPAGWPSAEEASPRLRLLHVIPWVAPRFGGTTTAVEEMCEALASGSIGSPSSPPT